MPQVPLAEGDDVLETLSTGPSDNSLDAILAPQEVGLEGVPGLGRSRQEPPGHAPGRVDPAAPGEVTDHVLALHVRHPAVLASGAGGVQHALGCFPPVTSGRSPHRPVAPDMRVSRAVVVQGGVRLALTRTSGRVSIRRRAR